MTIAAAMAAARPAPTWATFVAAGPLLLEVEAALLLALLARLLLELLAALLELLLREELLLIDGSIPVLVFFGSISLLKGERLTMRSRPRWRRPLQAREWQ